MTSEDTWKVRRSFEELERGGGIGARRGFKYETHFEDRILSKLFSKSDYVREKTSNSGFCRVDFFIPSEVVDTPLGFWITSIGRRKRYVCQRCGTRTKPKFLDDEDIIGGCSHCGETTNGNFCRNCHKYTEPFDLKNPTCKNCNTPPTIIVRTDACRQSHKQFFMRLGEEIDFKSYDPRMNCYVIFYSHEHDWNCISWVPAAFRWFFEKCVFVFDQINEPFDSDDFNSQLVKIVEDLIRNPVNQPRIQSKIWISEYERRVNTTFENGLQRIIRRGAPISLPTLRERKLEMVSKGNWKDDSVINAIYKRSIDNKWTVHLNIEKGNLNELKRQRNYFNPLEELIVQCIEDLRSSFPGKFSYEGGPGIDVKGLRVWTVLRDIPEIIDNVTFRRDSKAGQLGEDFTLRTTSGRLVLIQCKTAQSGIQYKDARRIVGRSMLYRYGIKGLREGSEPILIKKDVKNTAILDGDWRMGGEKKQTFGLIEFMFQQGIDEIFFVDEIDLFKKYLERIITEK